MPLTTRWGWYAWQKFVPFKIDNHLIFANSHYRGRPLSDANIQVKFKSDKYFTLIIAELFIFITIKLYFLCHILFITEIVFFRIV